MLPARLGTIDTRLVKPPPKEAKSFYLSPEWRQLMDRLIEERGRICQDHDCPRPHPPITRIFGDHVIELEDGGAPLDPKNILLRCGAAHTRKTARARAARAGLLGPPKPSSDRGGEGRSSE